uniref:Uncharacterized protein n=1 Tax=Romanomermis culicivorax TaxID=13658 RepID=A0A915J3J3_ROMCU
MAGYQQQNQRFDRNAQFDEISKHLQKLKTKRENLEQSIKTNETEIARYDEQLQSISKKRQSLIDDLGQKRQALDNLNHTIVESESTYHKLVESSQTLLALIKKENMEVDKNLSKNFS